LKTKYLTAGFFSIFVACSSSHAKEENTGAPIVDAPAPRTIWEIQLAFDEKKQVFSELFYKAGVAPGKITVGFTITPEGRVIDCYIASSTYEDLPLEAAILSEVRKLKFSPRNVPEFTYPNYPIMGSSGK